MTRRISVVILIGLVGIATIPFVPFLFPSYPMYVTPVFDDTIVLNEGFPVYEIAFPFADKIVIEELTTNGSPVIVSAYWNYNTDNPDAILQNVTEIRGISLVCISLADTTWPVIRITRYDNQSVQISVRFGIWGTYPSTDFLMSSPTVFWLFPIPLVFLLYRNWGSRPDVRGFAIIIVLLVSAVLIAPILAYTYNNEGTLHRYDLVLETHTYHFNLNTSTPFIEFNESVELEDSTTFARIANFSTNGVFVAVTITPEDFTENVPLLTITNTSLSPLQFELPRGNLTGFTVRLDRIAQDATVNLSVETVQDVWKPWKDPVPRIQSAVAGLALTIVVLIFPQKTEALLSDETSSTA
ncbi:MAG: hypothetical protein ACFFE2_07255 [Candidatus Thorarchaeota archaeon]